MVGISVFLFLASSGCAAQATYWNHDGRLATQPGSMRVYNYLPPIEFQGNTQWNYPPHFYDYHQHADHVGSGSEAQHSFIQGKTLPPAKVTTNKPSSVSPHHDTASSEIGIPRNLSNSGAMINLFDVLEKSINPHQSQGRADENEPEHARAFGMNDNTYYDRPYSTPQIPAVPASSQQPFSLPAVVTPRPLQDDSPANIMSLLLSAARGLLQQGTGNTMASSALARLPTVLIQGLLIKITSTIAKDGLKGLIAKILVPLLVLVGVDVLIIILSWWLWDDSCAMAAITAGTVSTPPATTPPPKIYY